MKTISFFSAKGGTGKTTFNIDFASYLKYQLGKSVLYLDFDSPEYNCYFTRERELKAGAADTDLYPIECVENQSREKLAQISGMLKTLDGAVDYVIMDFPGSFIKEDAVCQLSLSGALDLMVIPVDLDEINLTSGNSLAMTMNEFGQKSIMFFNRYISKYDATYDSLSDLFRQRGIRMSDHRIKSAIAMSRDSDEKVKEYMRSTVEFPKAISRRNPEMIQLFDEVLSYAETPKVKRD